MQRNVGKHCESGFLWESLKVLGKKMHLCLHLQRQFLHLNHIDLDCISEHTDLGVHMTLLWQSILPGETGFLITSPHKTVL